MEIGKELMTAINPHHVFDIPLFGFNIPVSDTVIVTWVISLAIIVFAWILTRKLEVVPQGKQNIAESFIELVSNIAKSTIGHHYKPFVPYLGTILLFLIISNIITLFNFVPNWEQLYRMTHIEYFEHLPHFGIKPPTKDLNTTLALALMSISVVLYAGISVKGFKGWLKSFIEPVPVILPFKILDYFIRPISLCFRLFGNILGAFIIMELVYIAFPAVFPGFLSIYFDIFDGVLQAYVFVFLTSLYIAEAIE